MRPDPVDPEDPRPATPEEKLCASALGDFTDLLVAGNAPSADLFVMQHPECPQDMLRDALEAAVFMFDAFAAVRGRGERGEQLINELLEQTRARRKRKRPGKI